jgi:hypothetical protein
MPATREAASGAARLGITATALVLALVAASTSVLAQPPASPNASPSVAAQSSPGAAGDPDAIDIAALMPTRLGGLETDVMVERGRGHLDDLDPDDPADTQERADIERFLEATGAPIEALTTASAVAIDGDRALIVAAARVIDSEADLLRDAYVTLLSDAMGDPVVTAGQLGGRDVTILSSGSGEAAEPVYVYAVGDTVWLLAIPPDAALEVIEALP